MLFFMESAIIGVTTVTEVKYKWHIKSQTHVLVAAAASLSARLTQFLRVQRSMRLQKMLAFPAVLVQMYVPLMQLKQTDRIYTL